jgi:hypothetical protein
MTKWGTPDPAHETGDLFPDAPIAFAKPPQKPWSD